MALKRLDEEFELKPGTQLLPYMKRLLPSLEGRFQGLESTANIYASVIEEIRAAALMRMNEILIPATEDIVAVTKLGFLLAPVAGSWTLVLGYMTLPIEEGPQQDTFTPSPYLIIEHSPDDYAIARLISYDQILGTLEVTITALHGNPGPWDDWVVSSTPGMADSAKLYHDAIAPMHTEVVTDTEEVRQKHAEIVQAAEDLVAAGLNLYDYVKKDGSTPFDGVQMGVHPVINSNDNALTTTAWTRARMNEYLRDSMSSSGAAMTGPLYLHAAPSQPMQAANKAYVDSVIGEGGIINAPLTIKSHTPSLRLQSTATGEHRMIEALSVDGVRRWILSIADDAPMTGGNAGSNFSLLRYSDSGVYLDAPLQIDRLTGSLSAKLINMNGGLQGSGNVNFVGDLMMNRVSNAATGIMYMNQARTAYHHWDGGTHVLVGGGLSTNGGAISCGAVNSVGAFSTNGYPSTVWGETCHGPMTVNADITVNGNLQLNSAANYIRFYDNDWGMMYLHHQNQNIGFLNNGGGWIWYVNNDGHYWSPQYGWLHDYVNNTAYNHAVGQANAYVQNRVSNGRLVHAGDFGMGWNQQWVEPGNTVCTGLWSWYAGGQYIIMYMRSRYIQFLTTGWFTIGYG